MVWLGVAALGAVVSAGFVSRVHYRLRWRPNHRPRQDAWQRGRPALMGLTVSLIVLGVGLGGTLATFRSQRAPVIPPGVEMRQRSDTARPDSTGTEGDRTTWTDTTLDRLGQGLPVSTDSADAGTADSASAPGEPSTSAGPTSGEPVRTPPGDAFPGAAEPGEGPWAVRVGVFGVEANARAAVTALEEAGLTGFSVLRTGSSGRRLHFVYAGRFPSRNDAEAGAGRVRAAGFDAMAVPFTPPPEGLP